MLISRILAWISVVLCLLAALKWVARISKNKALNRFFRKLHMPVGELLLIVSGIHGVIAGNAPGTKLSQLRLFSVFFSLNWGTAAFVCAVLLAVVYLLRKKLRKKWMLCHRILTVVMLLTLVLHLFEIGLFLPLQPQPAVPEKETTVEAQTSATPTSEADTTVAAPSMTEYAEPTDPVTVSEPTEPIPLVTFSGAQLADGSYQGAAGGYHGQIYVTVTVENGEVTQIEIDGNNDTPKYFSRAVAVIDRILSAQSLDVDAVSGATYSSVGIRNAVYNALQDAVVSGELLNVRVNM